MTLKRCDKYDDISSSIEACIDDKNPWMKSNIRKMNKNKTEFIVLSPKQHVKITENLRIEVGSSYIHSSMSLRNLGLMLDNTLGM